MAGLLHDMGKMVIDTYFPDEQGMEHTEVGAWVAERWQLPEPLVNAIAFHHSLAPEHLVQPITACVHAARHMRETGTDGHETRAGQRGHGNAEKVARLAYAEG
jgi:HD-like signal output (HDOD) protein